MRTYTCFGGLAHGCKVYVHRAATRVTVRHPDGWVTYQVVGDILLMVEKHRNDTVRWTRDRGQKWDFWVNPFLDSP